MSVYVLELVISSATWVMFLPGQVQVSSPVPHRYQFTVDASQLSVGNHYKAGGTDLAVGSLIIFKKTNKQHKFT